jgi:phytoene dehydrogenase-like protein
LIVQERPETAGEAKGSALGGRMPADLVMEIAVPSVADDTLVRDGKHVMTVRVPYLPARIEGGWQAHEDGLRKRVLGSLESFAPGLSDKVIDAVVITPADYAARYGTGAAGFNPRLRLLLSYEARIRTPIDGLYLCGSDAEPIGAIAGRAGRLAALLVAAELQNGGGAQP